MIKKMIAIDLDGTLLKSDGTLSDYTVAIIKKNSRARTLGYHYDWPALPYGFGIL